LLGRFSAFIDRLARNLDENRLQPIASLIRFFDTLAILGAAPGKPLRSSAQFRANAELA
jgi:hypothetical protein